MKTAFLLAYRFLKSNKGQTIFIILGIGVGVSVQIFIGSLISGLQNSLIEKTIGNSSQITIKSDTKTFSNYEEIIKNIKDPKIIDINPVYENSTLLTINDTSTSLIIKGFDIGLADNIYNIIDSIVEGNVPSGDTDIILGINLKEEYNLSINDTITVVDKNKKIIEFKIVGFYDLGISSVNKTFGFTTLLTSQNIFGSGLITSIEMQVDNSSIFETDLLASDIASSLDENYIVTNWKEDNASLLSGLQGQSISSLMIQVFVMISVVLGISSVLAITVMQKSKQIGILKAMGLKNNMALYVFLFEGLMLGICGGLVGVILGYLLSLSFTTFALNPDGTPVIALYIDYAFIVLSFAIAVISCTLASIIPARKSANLNPIDIIRNN